MPPHHSFPFISFVNVDDDPEGPPVHPFSTPSPYPTKYPLANVPHSSIPPRGYPSALASAPYLPRHNLSQFSTTSHGAPRGSHRSLASPFPPGFVPITNHPRESQHSSLPAASVDFKFALAPGATRTAHRGLGFPSPLEHDDYHDGHDGRTRPTSEAPYGLAPNPGQIYGKISPHRGTRIDMSRSSIKAALTAAGLTSSDLSHAASMPPLASIPVKCDAFTDVFVVQSSPPGTAVTVGHLLKEIHWRLHGPLDESEARRTNSDEERRMPGERRRHRFDTVHCIDLLHGQHHFIGLKPTHDAYWNILFD